MSRLKIPPTTSNKLIGDRLEDAFMTWAEIQIVRQSGITSGPYLFCRWLMETADGDEALKILNAVPRQLWLEFEKPSPPWEVEE